MPDKKLLYRYFSCNRFTAAAGIYIILLLVLKAAWNIDIGIPCLWKLIFNIECPGCGLTHAGYCLFVFDLDGAARSNPLIFIVAPAIVYYLLQDLRKFNKQNS